jgi:saccharopine dehydrogenase (NAD+, L-lysine-forming)
MPKVVVLGGCGAVGTVAVKTLAKNDTFSEVVIGDMNAERAKKLIGEIGLPKVSFVPVNAEDVASVKAAIKGADVVLNCVGPFYKSVKTVVRAVLESKINYVDVCDDVDVTLELLDWDAEAKKAGITALIGMGSSPGATNVLAKLAYDTLLAETDSVDIFHAHGGEPFEGAGVIGHRFHCMTIDIPMYLDGQLKYVKYFEEGGIALRQKFSFPVLGDDVLLYPYPHPEQVTIPRYMKLRQVTNKGTVIPAEYYDMTRDLCQMGLASREPVKVNGVDVVPYDFALAYIIREREKILKKLSFGAQRGCCSVIVKGRNPEGKAREYRFHMASRSQALGEGTGIPAALGTILMQMGKIATKGVLPPEGCVNPMDFIPLIPQVMSIDKKKEGGESFGGIIIQKVDENGIVSDVEL